MYYLFFQIACKLLLAATTMFKMCLYFNLLNPQEANGMSEIV